MINLLNLAKPWDCESFPKSKTICYGGGGGGGGRIKLPKVPDPVKAVSKAVEDTKTTVSKAVEDTKETVKRSDLGSGAIETAVKKSDLGTATSAAIESTKKEGTKALNQISSEAGKLASGDFNLERAYKGTLKGAETTFKRSDIGVKGAELQDWATNQLFGSKKGKKSSGDTATKTTMGSSATMGEGGTQGMKMGDQMKSGQQVAKQNKRKLRISKKTVKV